MKDIRKVETNLTSYIKRLTRVRFVLNRMRRGAVQSSDWTVARINRFSASDCLGRLKSISSSVLRDIATIGMRDEAYEESRSGAIDGRSTDRDAAAGSVGLTTNSAPAQSVMNESVNGTSGVGVPPYRLPGMDINPTPSIVHRNNNSVATPLLVDQPRPIAPNRCPQLEYSRDLDIREIADDARNLLVDAINARQV